jgi:hypothetical protein
VLGNRDRAEVGAAIGLSEDGAVNATDLSVELNLPNSRVRAQLLAFHAGGLLEPQPSITGKHIYARVESPFWAACIDLLRKAAPDSSQSSTRDESRVGEEK